jgi:riboflavin synthase alpha subunit
MATARTSRRTVNLENALAAAARFGGESLIACGEIVAVSLAPPAAAATGRSQADGIVKPDRLMSVLSVPGSSP